MSLISIHSGDEVWAGKCMEHSSIPHLLTGSGGTVADEGVKIQWGFWLGPDLTPKEALDILSKLTEELRTHTKLYNSW